MTEVRKYLMNQTDSIDNYKNSRSDCSGTTSYHSTTTNKIVAYTEAGRHRRKPKRLLPTRLYYESRVSWVPFNSYDMCEKGHCKAAYRSGSFHWCHPSVGNEWTKRNSFNSAKANTYSLLAGSGFTASMANYGESLATLSETGQMIHRRVRQVVEIANALRRRNFDHLARILRTDLSSSVTRVPKGRELANGWLELEFGWKPLIQDIYTAVDLYRNSVVSGQLVKSARYGDRFSKRYSNGLSVGDWEEGSNRVSSRAYGIVSNPSAYTLNQLGLLNPALLAWNLLPFSFVVDWFLPISRILGHLTNRIGLSAYVICTVSEAVTTNKRGCSSGVYATNHKRVLRSVSSSVLPDVTVLSPRSLGLWHIATSSALLRQSFGR